MYLRQIINSRMGKKSLQPLQSALRVRGELPWREIKDVFNVDFPFGESEFLGACRTGLGTGSFFWIGNDVGRQDVVEINSQNLEEFDDPLRGIGAVAVPAFALVA